MQQSLHQNTKENLVNKLNSKTYLIYLKKSKLPSCYVLQENQQSRQFTLKSSAYQCSQIQMKFRTATFTRTEAQNSQTC